MKIANEAEMTAKVLQGVKNVGSLMKLSQRKSIMTMASPGMYMYPLIMSSGIDSDAQLALAKGFQMTYAAAVATAYSLNPLMDMDKVDNASDYVKKFHNNNASLLSADIKGVQQALGMEGYEDAEVKATVNHNIPAMDLVALNMYASGDIKDSLCTESLNDSYKPYTRTERIIKEKINAMKIAKEDAQDIVNSFGDHINDMGAKQTSLYNDGVYNRGTSTKTTITRDKDGNIEKTQTVKDDIRKPVVQTQFNQVVKNPQMESMEPTMVNVQVLVKGGKTPSINLTIGVKVMPRLVPTNLMIASMSEACRNSRTIFKFLKWSKGEVGTFDAIFGVSDARSKVNSQNEQMEKRFLKQLKKRKRLNGVGKFFNNEVLPTTTIIITTYEAARIKDECHVDLDVLQNAVKLLNSYYLLAFGIYDTEQGTLKVLFDCDTDWGYTTITSLKSSVNKTNDLLNQNEIIKIFGRK